MPLSTDLVGQRTAPITHEADARWLMAYAAGLGDCQPVYLDTVAGPVVAHPVFPVCLEWPANLAVAGLPGYGPTAPEERARGVHAGHDLHLLQPIRAGDVLTTEAMIVGVTQVSAGALQTTRFDTCDAAGVLMAQTWQQSLYRGVAVEGSAAPIQQPPELPAAGHVIDDDGRFSIPIAVAEGAAHVYTECARIFNPIHTDRAVALAAGLPDLILHGTATLALAVSALVNELLDGEPMRVKRLGGRFSGMVLMPDTLTLDARLAGEGLITYSITNARGKVAINDGYLCFRGGCA